MDEACAYAHTPIGIRFCSFVSLIEVLIRCENLSKYVCVLSYEKYAPKLQNFWHIRKRKVKKVAKQVIFCHFLGKKMVKSDEKLHFLRFSVPFMTYRIM